MQATRRPIANCANGCDFGGLDKFKRAANSVQILAGNVHGPGFAESHADKDGVEIFFELLEAYVPSDFHVFWRNSTPSDFTISTSRSESYIARFVCRDAVGAESTGKFARDRKS